MAKLVHVIILGILTIINVANCGDSRVGSVRKYVNICGNKRLARTASALYECILESSGIFDGVRGRVNVDRFRKIIQKISDPSVQNQVSPIVVNFKKCVKGRRFSTADNLIMALYRCNFDPDILYKF
ncbi:uncharacterized protein LOC107039169 [Diachasma alloeum]|uniref:uncharacterized protein LOC107039169 n=1 Tax=Diachasma alloeum TaxID=454923 RepID=UPI000738375C|nr:uncharacterized protein LOC107039169 [Diachasma alloeum]